MKYKSKTGRTVIEIPVTSCVHPKWTGWRFTEDGRYLVTPDGRHLTEARVLGLAWRDELELRRAGFVSRRKAEKARSRQQLVKVVVVDLADWHLTQFGSRAG